MARLLKEGEPHTPAVALSRLQCLVGYWRTCAGQQSGRSERSLDHTLHSEIGLSTEATLPVGLGCVHAFTSVLVCVGMCVCVCVCVWLFCAVHLGAVHLCVCIYPPLCDFSCVCVCMCLFLSMLSNSTSYQPLPPLFNIMGLNPLHMSLPACRSLWRSP